MAKSLNWWTRKIHRWGAIAIALPLLLVICSGLLLQVKKQWTWVQPATIKGSKREPTLDWSRMVTIVSEIEEAEVEDWNDIDRIDVRVGKGVSKVQCHNGWEVQIDSATGDILSSAYRRSDLIEDLHDGSFFGEPAKLWVFLPGGVILLALWLTGAYLWYLPLDVKRRKRLRRLAAHAVDLTQPGRGGRNDRPN